MKKFLPRCEVVDCFSGDFYILPVIALLRDFKGVMVGWFIFQLIWDKR